MAGTMIAEMPKADSHRAHSTPARRVGSIRRTSSMEMNFPQDLGGTYFVKGRARDVLTRTAGAAPEVLAEDSLTARVSVPRIIEDFASDPPLPAEIALVGQSALAGYRAAIAPAVALPAYTDRPLALLLDDMVGSAIINTWVKVRCDGDVSARRSGMENVCAGYATGSYSLTGNWREFADVEVPPLQLAEDLDAFHELAADAPRTVRRARRIDVWRTAQGLAIDAMFQDSGVTPDGVRLAIHEYRFFAEAQERGGEMVLTGLDVVPGALPYDACRAAPLSGERLYGTPLPELRRRVLAELRGPVGCTHLNDAYRSIAAATALAQVCPA